MTTVTGEIDNFIKDNGGCTRDALNIALFTIETLRIEIELFKFKIEKIESIVNEK